MALIKTRPNLRLLLPRPLVAGGIAEFIVEVDCPEPLPVDAVSLTLRGEVVWFTTSQYGRHRDSSCFLDHVVPLLERDPNEPADQRLELSAGKHLLRTRVQLNEALPGSWEGDRLHIEYGVRIHVDIPWWPDKRSEFVVRVTGTGQPPAEEPVPVFVSHAGGPPAKGPYLELSIGRREVDPGATLPLRAALGNVERNRYRKLHVAVVARESFPMGIGGDYVHDHVVRRWAVDVDDHLGELRPIPFSIELPRAMSPGFAIHGCKLRWQLQVHADVAWGVDPKLWIPLEVRAPTLPALEPGDARSAPLAVGSDRLRLIWSSVARSTGLEFVDGQLRGAFGEAGIRLELRRSHDDNGRARVLGQLEFPELGVALRPHRARRTLLGGFEPSLAGRDLGQSEVLDAQLRPQLVEGQDLGFELVDADDRKLVFALDGAGLELAPLRRFVDWLIALAPTLRDLPGQLPFPAPMAAHAPAWAEAAARLGAELRRGDLQIALRRDALGATLGCVWDDEGQLRGTALELDPGLAIASRHQLLWTGDTALPDHELALDDLIAPPTWSESARVALHIEARRVRVLLPAPLHDPLVERPRLEALFSLGRQLHGEQGPYR